MLLCLPQTFFYCCMEAPLQDSHQYLDELPSLEWNSIHTLCNTPHLTSDRWGNFVWLISGSLLASSIKPSGFESLVMCRWFKMRCWAIVGVRDNEPSFRTRVVTEWYQSGTRSEGFRASSGVRSWYCLGIDEDAKDLSEEVCNTPHPTSNRWVVSNGLSLAPY